MKKNRKKRLLKELVDGDRKGNWEKDEKREEEGMKRCKEWLEST